MRASGAASWGGDRDDERAVQLMGRGNARQRRSDPGQAAVRDSVGITLHGVSGSSPMHL